MACEYDNIVFIMDVNSVVMFEQSPVVMFLLNSISGFSAKTYQIMKLSVGLALSVHFNGVANWIGIVRDLRSLKKKSLSVRKKIVIM